MLATVAAFSSNPASADELLYIYSPDCGACMKFDQEIAGIYPKTQEAQNLPLIKIDLVDWRAETHPASQCAINPVLGTPTFIQVHECTEVDRITVTRMMSFSGLRWSAWTIAPKALTNRLLCKPGPRFGRRIRPPGKTLRVAHPRIRRATQHLQRSVGDVSGLRHDSRKIHGFTDYTVALLRVPVMPKRP